jgi:hypothetical protein
LAITGSLNGLVALWDTKGGTIKQTIPLPLQCIHQITFDQENQLAITQFDESGKSTTYLITIE